VRTLAVMKDERSLGAPDIPTTRDAGLRDAVAYTYNIILAPARTPRGIVDHVSMAIARVMADETFRGTLIRLGVDPIEQSGPEKAAAMLETELAKWRPIIQALGLGADTPTRSASPRR
jgi:tripartite-type tricarboxylate transporter receptor subunit TctC